MAQMNMASEARATRRAKEPKKQGQKKLDILLSNLVFKFVKFMFFLVFFPHSSKRAGAFEAPRQTNANDTSRHPKVLRK